VPLGLSGQLRLERLGRPLLDELRWLFGPEIVAAQVFAPRKSGRGGTLQDALLVLFEMADGVLVDVEVSVNIHYGYEIRCEVSGETGTVELADPAPVHVRRDGAVAGLVPAGWQSSSRHAPACTPPATDTEQAGGTFGAFRGWWRLCARWTPRPGRWITPAGPWHQARRPLPRPDGDGCRAPWTAMVRPGTS
jgi:predicted dehydrogenase